MVDDEDFLPGDGPTSRISVTLTAGTLKAVRERADRRGVSSYLEKAAQRQMERDNLDELIADFDQVNGPADPQAVAAKRARLTGGGAARPGGPRMADGHRTARHGPFTRPGREGLTSGRRLG